MYQNLNRGLISRRVKMLGITALLGLCICLNLAYNSMAAIPSPRIIGLLAKAKPNLSLEKNKPAQKPIKFNLAAFHLQADTTDKVFTYAEQMPVFPGGSAAQNKFILMNLRYPAEARKAGLTGLVVAQFVVNKKGKIQDIAVVKGVSKELDEEVMRIIKLMPDFTPAKQNGQPVSFRYTLPVWFSLDAKTPTNATLDTVNARIFTQAENPPQFPGGESALNAFIKKNLDYPKDVKKSKTEGLVVVQFLVDENGKLFYPKITKSINHILDAEAMRLVSLLPAFIPAKQNGKPVVFRYTLPVRFDL